MLVEVGDIAVALLDVAHGLLAYRQVNIVLVAIVNYGSISLGL